MRLQDPPEHRTQPVIRLGPYVRAWSGRATQSTVWAFAAAHDPAFASHLPSAGLWLRHELGVWTSTQRRTHACLAAFAPPGEARHLASTMGVPRTVLRDCRFTPILVPWRGKWLLAADAWGPRRLREPVGSGWRAGTGPGTQGWTSASAADASAYRGIAPRAVAEAIDLATRENALAALDPAVLNLIDEEREGVPGAAPPRPEHELVWCRACRDYAGDPQSPAIGAAGTPCSAAPCACADSFGGRPAHRALPLEVRTAVRPRASRRAWRGTSAELGRLAVDTARRRRPRSDDEVNALVPKGERLSAIQRDGVRWMLDHPVALNAAPMGAGKTIITIAALNGLLAAGERAAIVVPAFLRPKWMRELERWLARRLKRELVRSRVPRVLPAEGVMLMSYETAVARAEEIGARGPLALAVADEAQLAKNLATKRGRTLASLDCLRRMWITGTPIYNRPPDLQIFLASACPEAWGDRAGFRRAYALKDPAAPTPDERDMLEGVGRLLRETIMWRPSAEQVLASLPRKPPPELVEVDIGSTVEIRERELALLNRYRVERGARATILAQLKVLQLEVARRKVDAIGDQIRIFAERRTPFLAFAYHREIAEAMAARARDAGLATGTVHGGFSAERREEACRAFQAGELDALALTMSAAGAGLDLQRAQAVLIAELDWSPSVIDQAVARAWRIGQVRPVRTLYFCCPGTIDATMAGTLVGKTSSVATALEDRTPERVLARFEAEARAPVSISETPAP